MLPILSLLALPLLAPARAQEVIVDDQDGAPGFTTTGDDWTTWSMNGHGFDGGDTEYHYLSHTVGGSDRRGTATWSPDLSHDGTWAVDAWYRLTENRTRDADHIVTDGHGATTPVVLDQAGDGPSGWVSLGQHWCSAGRGGCTVTLDGTDDDESDEANAMRFTLIAAGGGEDTGTGPTDERGACGEFPGLGAHSQTTWATAIDAVDWTDKKHAKGAADGAEATTPNVDAGEYLRAGGWGLCDPVGEETLDAVTLEVLARTQYDSGMYEVRLRLDGQGSAHTVFNGTGLDWHRVDLTPDRSGWTWAEADAIQGQVSLHDHPGGARDSDAWIDAWRLTVAYTTTADDDADSEASPAPRDSASSDSADTGEAGPFGDSAASDTGQDGPSRPGDPRYEGDVGSETGCGCASGPRGGVGIPWIGALLVLVWRRQRGRGPVCAGTWPAGREHVLMN